MEPIRKTRIDDSVYSMLLDNIKNNLWKAGDKLPSEGELCSMLQVSRVSVRSALQRLQALGFIEVKRAKGSFVTGFDDFDFASFDQMINLTQKEFDDIGVVRQALEDAAIRLILENNETTDFTRMEEALEGMGQAVETLDLEKFTQYDMQFHFAGFLASGNEKIARIVHIFRDDFYRYLREMNKFMLRYAEREKNRPGFADSYQYHCELLAALRDKDRRASEIQWRQLSRASESRAYYFQKVSGRLTPRKEE